MNLVAVLRRDGLFLIAFAISKLCLYAAPFLIAYLAPAEVYASVEFGLAAGLLVAALLIGAPVLGATQSYLIAGNDAHKSLPLGIGAIVCGAIALVAFGLWLAGMAADWLLITTLMGVSFVQYISSGVFRMRSMRISTSWADGFAALSICAAAVALWVYGAAITASGLALVMIVVIAGAAWLFSLAAKRELGSYSWRGLRTVSRRGFPMMVLGVMAVWIGVGGRIQIGLVAAESLVIYSLAFRFAGLAHGVRQFVMTALFAKLYQATRDSADRIYSIFLALIVLLLLVILIFVPAVLVRAELTLFDLSLVHVFIDVLAATSVHTLFWIGFAMLQTRINRYEIAGRVSAMIATTTVAGVSAFGLVAIFVTQDLTILSWIIAIHGAAYFIVNFAALSRHGHRYKWMAFVCLAGACLIMAAMPVSHLLSAAI